MHKEDHSVSDPQVLAQAAADAMFERDRASRGQGIALAEVRPGYARMTMTVGPGMLNGHDTCHGGFIFMLADSAFAFACNSHNLNTVGAACSIDYLAPGRLHDVLCAEAVEQALAGRSGIYDVKVSNQDGLLIALFRGKSQRISGEVVTLPG
ncbi:MAG: acyl-CoA thioesterase [Janthinobacterium sp.]|jgi:acyl-CoA thioesterase